MNFKHLSKNFALIVITCALTTLPFLGQAITISSPSGMKHLRGTPGGIPLIGKIPKLGQYPTGCKNVAKLLKLATGISAGGAGASAASYAAFYRLGWHVFRTYGAEMTFLAKSINAAKTASSTTGPVSAAIFVTTAATLGGLYGANCKYRLSTFNNTDNTQWCKVDIARSQDALFKLKSKQSVVIAGGIGFPIRKVFCSTSKQTAARNSNKSAYKAEWKNSCKKFEMQVTLSGKNTASTRCVKP